MFSKSTSESNSGSPRFNVLAVAPEGTPFIAKVEELRQANPVFELVVVAKIEDGFKLLRRGTIAAVLLYGHPQAFGTAELVIEGLSKERAPRFVIFMDDAPGGIPIGEAWVRVVRTAIDVGQIRRLLEQCCHEFENRPSKNNLNPLEVFEAFAYCPDEVWIRVTHDSGESGDFCIREGRAVYCEVGRISGEAAASRLLSWTSCRFESRDFPSFLRPNMDRRLDDLRSLKLSNPAFASPAGAPVPAKADAVPAASATPQPPPARPQSPVEPPSPTDSKTSADFEEPTEFPSLAQFVEQVAAAQPAETKPQNTDPSLDEPDELPLFSIAEGDLAEVEEPLQMLSMPDFMDKLENDLEEPMSLPDFAQDVGAANGVPESLLFASVAVINAGQLVSCRPADDAAVYDAGALFSMFKQAESYARNQAMGSPEFVLLGGANKSILVGAIPGSDSLFAVRTNTSILGEIERGEIQRLKETLQITYSTVSV